MNDKEIALTDFIEMTKKSWTYNRLTEKERANCLEALRESKLKGTFRQRWDILQSVYHGFLIALDYKPIGWREPETNEPIPQF